MIVLVPAPVYEELRAPAQAVAPGVRLLPYAEDDAPVEGADEAEAVFRWIAGKRYADLVVDGPRVRWLHTASAGMDHVLTRPVREATQARNILVTDSGAAFEIAIAEFVLAWMLMVTRRLPTLLEMQHARDWRWLEQDELFGQTVGIVGLGPIGRGIAARAKAFGMRTLGLRRTSEPIESVDETLTGRDGLERLLAESDWVVLAAALTGETRHLIGAGELACMKPSARLINIARGDLVDEAALIDALRANRIDGACLDVFAREPLPQNSPLWDLPNVYVSPHSSSGWTRGLHERQKRLFIDNLARFVRGEPLAGIVDVRRGY